MTVDEIRARYFASAGVTEERLAAALVADGFDPPPAIGQQWEDPAVTWLPGGHKSIVTITGLWKTINGWRATVRRRQVDADGATVESGDGKGSLFVDRLLADFRPVQP